MKKAFTIIRFGVSCFQNKFFIHGFKVILNFKKQKYRINMYSKSFYTKASYNFYFQTNYYL